MNFLNGYKTYLSALGLVGLGVFQVSTGDIAGGIQSILGAAAAASVRHAIANPAVPAPAASSPAYGPGPAGMGGRASM